MLVSGYLETLDRFGLKELKDSVDVQLENGNIAVTSDGDLKAGNDRINALFRLVQRWRMNESTINLLFNSTLATESRLAEVLESRKHGRASLNIDPQAFLRASEIIDEGEQGSSVFAGAILVVLNNLLQRFKNDLRATDDQWKSTEPKFYGYSLGEVLWASAANFRHHDEWAKRRPPTKQQMASMPIVAKFLDRPVLDDRGFATIRTNICREILEVVSDRSIDRLHNFLFMFAKNLTTCVASRRTGP